MRTSKYYKFTKYLLDSKEDSITLSYEEIETILGFMPPSAIKYQAPWHDSHGSPFSKSWTNAGYSIKNNFKDKKATFYKKTSNIVTIQKQVNKTKQEKQIKLVNHTNTLKIENAIEAIKKFHNKNKDGEFTRYKSWEHCYKAFQEMWCLPDKKDLLALNLGWYLASWGMLRSSFLLKFDYKVHYDVIDKLTNIKYKALYEEPEVANVDLVIEASKDIKMSYGGHNLTDTLITKILLGVFGSAPAFDRFFKTAAKKYNFCQTSFNKHSLISCWSYYFKYKESLDKLISELTLDGIKYTPMKLIDMALFQLGQS